MGLQGKKGQKGKNNNPAWLMWKGPAKPCLGGKDPIIIKAGIKLKPSKEIRANPAFKRNLIRMPGKNFWLKLPILVC